MNSPTNARVFSHAGYCPICESKATFTSKELWFRDHLICGGCGSIPRERALLKIIQDHFPNYRDLAIHESSPGGRGASIKLHRECPHYSASHYYPETPSGQVNPESGYRSENIECLSFARESFDLFITQDVMEHIFNPERAFKEIARVLKPGGAHVFTVPLVNKTKSSERRASLDANMAAVLHHPAEYHANPADPNGSLVTFHWGYDIAAYILASAEMPTTIFSIDNIDMGIRAEYIDVVLSQKTAFTGAFNEDLIPSGHQSN
jgi:SAM-dependent methyltransferase